MIQGLVGGYERSGLVTVWIATRKCMNFSLAVTQGTARQEFAAPPRVAMRIADRDSDAAKRGASH